MKIGSGRLRGRIIDCPPGRRTRPTSGRLKKALFDIVATRLPGARVLDLFAGAGALGLEAISRGASWVTFVERSRAGSAAIGKNLDNLELIDQAEVLRRDVRSALTVLVEIREPFHFIFLDPPYGSHIHASVLGLIEGRSLLAPDGIVVVEHHHKRALSDEYGKLRRVRQVRAGESRLSFYSF